MVLIQLPAEDVFGGVSTELSPTVDEDDTNELQVPPFEPTNPSPYFARERKLSISKLKVRIGQKLNYDRQLPQLFSLLLPLHKNTTNLFLIGDHFYSSRI